MLEKNYHTAKNFWTNRDQYPSYDNIEARRLCDIQYIAPRLGSTKSLLDLGCGDGKISFLLSHLTKVSRFTLADLSGRMVHNAHRSLLGSLDHVFDSIQVDFSKPKDLPKRLTLEFDTAICLGLFPYIFDDDDLSSSLRLLKVKQLIVRTPCTLNSKDEIINTHSKALDAQYSAVYRTLKNTIAIIEPHFRITEVDRIYPDEIESKFGTKQFVFNCDPCGNYLHLHQVHI